MSIISRGSSVEFAPAFPGLLRYGDIFARSERNLAASVIEGTTDEKRSSPVRRTFLLVAVIDLIIVAIFWILFLKIAVDNDSFISALKNDICHLNFELSMFDNIILVVIRFLSLQIAYGAFKSSSAWFIAIITGFTNFYLILKIALFNFKTVTGQNGSVLAYTLLIIHIIIPWLETIFLECRVFPQEKAAKEVMNVLEDARSEISYRTFKHRAPTYVTSVYGSPNASLDGFLIQDRAESLPEEPIGVDAVALLSMGNKIYESSLTLLDDSAWHMNLAKLLAHNDQLMVQMASIKGYKCKLFRIDGILKASPLVVFRELVEGVNSSATWNPLLDFAKRLQLFKEQNMDVVHTIIGDQVKGLVKSRDFVILRKWGEFSSTRGQYYITSSSVEHPKCPVSPDRIRAHQHISATTLVPLSADFKTSGTPTFTHFTMIVCNDLGGWLLQSVIDQASTGTLEEFFRALQKHISSYSIEATDSASDSRKLRKPRPQPVEVINEQDNEGFQSDEPLVG